jgi:hypothetical protein
LIEECDVFYDPVIPREGASKQRGMLEFAGVYGRDCEEEDDAQESELYLSYGSVDFRYVKEPGPVLNISCKPRSNL